MRMLLAFCRGIDRVNEKLGVLANVTVLAACLISAGNALSRYLLSQSSNGWLEIQWYLFAAMVMLGAPYTLRRNEHVRVDLLYGNAPLRVKAWIDLFGGIFFLMPICLILVYFTWGWFVESWHINEVSSNSGGLPRWPVKLLLPVGFGMMALQGVSEITKTIAVLRGLNSYEFTYEKPLQ
jgi:TRAP-type mannitol/chloroaromatic compound transport system permease small subunit